MVHQKNIENILGYGITTLGSRVCINKIRSWIESGETGKYFVCANPHSLKIAKHDSNFAKAISQANLITPDGVGIIVASKILGGTIKDRITGSYVFRELSRVLNEKGGTRYFFLGSSEITLERLAAKVPTDYPNIEIAGTYSPPFKPKFSNEDSRRMIEAVNKTRPNVLWVGMTAPKQEKWIYRYKEQLDVNVIGAIGAVFDFYIGNIKRSHPWFLRHGLEWFPRLLKEPRRLYDRTLISAPKFMLMVLKQRLGLI